MGVSGDEARFFFENNGVSDTGDFSVNTSVGPVFITNVPQEGDYSAYFRNTDGFLNNSFLKIQGNYSISVWVYINGTDSSKSGAIFQQGGGNNEQILFVNPSLKRLGFTASTGGTQPTATVYYGTTFLNRWHHIVAMANSTNITIFVDGIFNASNKVAGKPLSTDKNLAIGYRPGVAGSELDTVIIDRLRIFLNETLSAEDATEIYDDEKNINAPLLYPAVCTSCVGGDNETFDTTPTINVTCIYSDWCQSVRIANSSLFNFTTATSARNCTKGTGTTWVCTLPLSDELTVLDKKQPLFFWANDTIGNAHKVYNLSIEVIYSKNFTKLDGVPENRTYEYETTARITTSYDFIDVLDGTKRYINVSSPLNYLIDILRINQFNHTNTTRNLSSGGTDYIKIDNRTDLYNATINLTGYSRPGNISLNYTDKIIFPGSLIVNNLYQKLIYFSGVYYERINFSFSTAGSTIFYINYSNQGKILNRTGYLNFTITAFDLDYGNDFDFTDRFNNSDFVGSNKNTSTPVSVFEDFENNLTDSMWTVDNDCNGINRFTFGNPDDYYHFTNPHSGSSSTGSSCVNNLGYTSGDISLNNISRFNITVDSSCTYSRANGHSTNLEMGLYVTDGTDDQIVYNILSCTGAGAGVGSSASKGLIIHGSRNSDGTWDVYQNSTKKKNDLSLTGMDDLVRLTFRISAGGNTGGEGGSYSTVGDFKIYNFNTSGIRLKRLANSYSLDNFSEFESSTLVTATNNVNRIFVTADLSQDSQRAVVPFVSNDDGVTFEVFTLGEFHTFLSTGNEIKVKFALNTTNSTITPIVRSYRVQIIPASTQILVIDVGDDGITDMQLNFTLNSTTTPINYTGNDTGINNYINRSCLSLESCLIPVFMSIGSGGILEISNFNLTENINPVSFNVSNIQTLNLIPITPTYHSGKLQIDDISFDFRGSKNISVITNNGSYEYSINRTIRVKYSPFDLSFPSIATAWEIFPSALNQSSIEPFGQNDSHGIWEITSSAYDGNSSIFVRYNQSINSCVTKQEFKGQNFSQSPLTNISTLNVTLTTQNQILISDLNDISVANIKSFTMINCSDATIDKFLLPYFCFDSLCSECVLSSDYQSDCEVVI